MPFRLFMKMNIVQAYTKIEKNVENIQAQAYYTIKKLISTHSLYHKINLIAVKTPQRRKYSKFTNPGNNFRELEIFRVLERSRMLGPYVTVKCYEYSELVSCFVLVITCSAVAQYCVKTHMHSQWRKPKFDHP